MDFSDVWLGHVDVLITHDKLWRAVDTSLPLQPLLYIRVTCFEKRKHLETCWSSVIHHREEHPHLLIVVRES